MVSYIDHLDVAKLGQAFKKLCVVFLDRVVEFCMHFSRTEFVITPLWRKLLDLVHRHLFCLIVIKVEVIACRLLLEQHRPIMLQKVGDLPFLDLDYRRLALGLLLRLIDGEVNGLDCLSNHHSSGRRSAFAAMREVFLELSIPSLPEEEFTRGNVFNL